MKTKTEDERSPSVHAIGLSYSLLSCSPAELNSALPNETKIKNQIAQFKLHSLKGKILDFSTHSFHNVHQIFVKKEIADEYYKMIIKKHPNSYIYMYEMNERLLRRFH